MKTALITGISKGIGKALAEKFLVEGWRVVGTSTSGEVSFTHENLTVFKVDLSSSEDIIECTQKIIREHFFFDVLVNNAGVLHDLNDDHVIIEKLRKTLEVNLIGTIDFTEHVLSTMLLNGHIINISSSAGSFSDTRKHFYPSYKISKAALNMYTRTLAHRLKSKNITVSSVHPGWVRTDMGGKDAPMLPEEAAQDIFQFAVSKPESGNFWHKSKPFAW